MGSLRVAPDHVETANEQADEQDPVFHSSLTSLKGYDGGLASFGSVMWPSSRKSPTKWACVGAQTTTPDQLMALLMQPWKLIPPSALISIVENVSSIPGDMPLSAQQLLLLQDGVRKAAQTSAAWVVTLGIHMLASADEDGTNAVASALNGTGVPCIGIPPASSVPEVGIMRQLVPGGIHRHGTRRIRGMLKKQATVSAFRHSASSTFQVQLGSTLDPPPSPPEGPTHSRISADEGEERMIGSDASASAESGPATSSRSPGKNPPVPRLSPLPTSGTTATFEPTSARGSSPASPAPSEPSASSSLDAALDESLSHIILVDDGTTSTAASVPVRTAFEAHIASTDFSNDGIKTPVVLLAIKGDMQTLRDVHMRLAAHRPVVILCDTGGVCESISKYFTNGMLPKAGDGWVLGAEEEAEAAKLLPLIKELGEFDGHNGIPALSFHCLADAETGLDGVLLDAMLNACETTEEEILLSVAWGEPSILERLLERVNPGSESITAKTKALAFEAALLRANAQTLALLIDFEVSPDFVVPAHLFIQELNVYHLEEGAMLARR